MNANARRRAGTQKKKKQGKVDTIEKLAMLVAEGFAEVKQELHREVNRLDRKVDDLRQETKGELAKLRKEMATKGELAELRVEMHEGFAELRAEVRDARREIEAIKQQVGHMVGYAKEIDYLLERVARIEEHIGIAR